MHITWLLPAPLGGHSKTGPIAVETHNGNAVPFGPLPRDSAADTAIPALHAAHSINQ